MDSIPIVCLTGQVPTHLIGKDAFQEADTTGITRPCTKHNYLVQGRERSARIIHEAFHIARTGRPGPVVIDIPKDVQFADGNYQPPQAAASRHYQPQTKPDRAQIEKAVALDGKSQTADFLYRRRRDQCRRESARKLLTELVRMTGFPCTSTLMGLGALSDVGQAVPRHARHARHLGSQSRDAWLRRDDQYRRAFR